MASWQRRSGENDEKWFDLKKILILFIFERDRVWMGEGQRERETESRAGSGLWAISTERDAGLKPTNYKIMTWAEVGRPNNWATQASQKWFGLEYI